jgi:flavin reductase (DIM6/NTAB) family NADH-FMN oxidoreductase RutF
MPDIDKKSLTAYRTIFLCICLMICINYFKVFYNQSIIQSWERFYRANFINSLTGFKSVSLIGTVDKNGQSNLGVFSSIVHIGSDPALVGYINRPRKAAPHTLANIESTGVYTINHIHPSYLANAHQTSAKYPEGVSEFNEVGLTMEFVENIISPFVKESRVKYALSLQEIIPINLNETFLVIGKVELVKVEDNIVTPDGFIDLHKAETVCSNGIDSYYLTQPAGRFTYAKPGISAVKIW